MKVGQGVAAPRCCSALVARPLKMSNGSKPVAEPLRFGVGEGPVGDAGGVDPRVAQSVVAIDIDDVEGRGRIDAGETAEGDQAIMVGAREVLRPSAAESARSITAAILCPQLPMGSVGPI